MKKNSDLINVRRFTVFFPDRQHQLNHHFYLFIFWQEIALSIIPSPAEKYLIFIYKKQVLNQYNRSGFSERFGRGAVKLRHQPP